MQLARFFLETSALEIRHPKGRLRPLTPKKENGVMSHDYEKSALYWRIAVESIAPITTWCCMCEMRSFP